MRFSAICFDLDGVIINSEPLHEAAFRSALSHYDLPLSTSSYQDYFAGKTDEQGFIDYLSSLDVAIQPDSLLVLKHRAFVSLGPDRLIYYEGMPGLITDLDALTPLALVTGSSFDEVQIALRGEQLGQHFSCIITADDITRGKPDPEGYLLAASRLGDSIEPATCIAVEDSPSGVTAAKRAGMYCVAVTTTHAAEQLSMADMVVNKLDLSMFTQILGR